MKRILLTVCLLLALWPGTAPGQQAPSIEQLIADLDSPSWKSRQAATSKLIKLGKRAVPALRRAIQKGSPEARWRARDALNRILPTEGYQAALRLASAGQLAEAAAKMKPMLSNLPKGTRPDPAWTLEILEEVRDLAPDGLASLSRAIAYHNLQCLLREAGMDTSRTLEIARKIYRRLLPGSRRAARLLAVLDWEAGDRKTAHKHLTMGKPTTAEMKQMWTLYDCASYRAVQGRTKEALALLSQAIAQSEAAREEARKSSDFSMLQKLPAFKRLLTSKPSPAKKKPKVKAARPR